MKYEITLLPGVKKTENPTVVVGTRHIFQTFDDLSKAIVKCAWSPGVFKGDHRKKANFEFADVMGLDFDDGLPMKIVADRLKNLGLDFSISLTRHHQKPKKSGDSLKPACDRFRVLIPLEERICSLEEFEATWAFLFEHFPEIDIKCKDPSRLFFASINGRWEE